MEILGENVKSMLSRNETLDVVVSCMTSSRTCACMHVHEWPVMNLR
jgi:hypothetical protein